MGCKYSKVKPLGTGRASRESNTCTHDIREESVDEVVFARERNSPLTSISHSSKSESPCKTDQVEVASNENARTENLETGGSSSRSTLVKDNIELELIDLESDISDVQEKNHQRYIIDTRDRSMRPTAAKGERKRPIVPQGFGATSSLPSCVRKFEEKVDQLLSAQSAAPVLIRPKAAKGPRTPHICSYEDYLPLPGVVMSENDSSPKVVRPNLTVKGLRTPQDDVLDGWIQRQQNYGGDN